MSRAENSKRLENGMIKLLRKFLKKRCQQLGKRKGNLRSLKGGAVGNVGPTGESGNGPDKENAVPVSSQ